MFGTTKRETNIWLRRPQDRPAARERRAEVRRETASALLHAALFIALCGAAACLTARSGGVPEGQADTAYVFPG